MGHISNNGFRDKDTNGDCPYAAWTRSGLSWLEHHKKHCRRGLQIPVSCDSGDDCTIHLNDHVYAASTRLRPYLPVWQRVHPAPSVQDTCAKTYHCVCSRQLPVCPLVVLHQ